MVTRQRRPSRIGKLAMPAITAVFLAYFSYHAFHGAYGVASRAELDAQAARLQLQLDGLTAERERLQLRVSLMRPESIDQDMIDERARETLNLVHPNDLVIPRQVAVR